MWLTWLCVVHLAVWVDNLSLCRKNQDILEVRGRLLEEKCRAEEAEKR